MGEARFSGKVALVTGGTSGIGRAVAEGFAREGAAVVITGRNAERGAVAVRALRDTGARAIFVAGDIGRAADAQAMVTTAVEEFGRLDCAVNNAASFDTGVFKPTADFDEAECDGHIAANLKGVWACLKHELPRMTAQGGGAIVNTSSVNGLGGVPMNALYAAAKAGVLALTKSAALEYARHGIRVNALVAGAFRTPMLTNVMSRVADGDLTAAEEHYAAMVPLGRIGRPAEAAAAVLWLCSDEASYVTGHSMIVDGGLTAPYR